MHIIFSLSIFFFFFFYIQHCIWSAAVYYKTFVIIIKNNNWISEMSIDIFLSLFLVAFNLSVAVGTAQYSLVINTVFFSYKITDLVSCLPFMNTRLTVRVRVRVRVIS